MQGHRQSICSLAFSRDGKWLASTDTAGETRLWKRSDWSTQVIYRQDAETYGGKAAEAIAEQAKFRPLAFAGNSRLVVPTFASNPGERRLRWRLVEINVADPSDFHALETIHYGIVTALTAASPDGARLASADAEGKLYLWDRTHGGPPQTLAPGRGVLALSFSPDGRTLLAGTLAGSDGKSQLQVWNAVSSTLARRVPLADHVYACAVSPDGNRLAYSGGERASLC